MNDSIYCYDKERDEFLKQFSFVVEAEFDLQYLAYYVGKSFSTFGICRIPPGRNIISLVGLMENGAFYIHIIGENNNINETVKKMEAVSSAHLVDRLCGIGYFMELKQLQTLPVHFISGELQDLVSYMEEYQRRHPTHESLRTENNRNLFGQYNSSADRKTSEKAGREWLVRLALFCFSLLCFVLALLCMIGISSCLQ